MSPLVIAIVILAILLLLFLAQRAGYINFAPVAVVPPVVAPVNPSPAGPVAPQKASAELRVPKPFAFLY